MFYEKEEIEHELLTCPSCALIFDTPYMLPCGETICSRCLNRFTDNGHSKLLSCRFCKALHSVPHDGFPKEKRLINLLNKKPKKIYRGVEFDRAEEMLNEIRVLTNGFYRLINDFKGNIRKYCDHLREVVENDTNKAIEEHEACLQKYFNEISQYERKCYDNLNYQSQIEKNYSQYLTEITQQIEKYSDLMNKSNITKTDIDNVINFTLNMRVKLLTEIDALNRIFNDKVLKFQKHVFISTEQEQQRTDSTSVFEVQANLHFGRLYYEEKGYELLESITNHSIMKNLPDFQINQKEQRNSLSRAFLTFKQFSSILLSPMSHISSTIFNFFIDELDYFNSKVQDNILEFLTFLYSIYIKS